MTLLLRGVLILATAALSSVVSAETVTGPGLWLNAAYTYTDIVYKESTLSQRGRFAGAQGELGFNLFGNVGVSGGAQYMAGNMKFDGETFDDTGSQVETETFTKDYLRDYRVLAHIFYGPVSIAGGVGQRYWYNRVVDSYRSRAQYDYFPMIATYHRRNFYVKFETDFWKTGKVTRHMGDVDSDREDVHFKQKKGGGYGVEVGVLLMTQLGISTRVYASYHKWDVKASDMQNDGVDDLEAPDSTTTTMQVGIGLNF